MNMKVWVKLKGESDDDAESVTLPSGHTVSEFKELLIAQRPVKLPREARKADLSLLLGGSELKGRSRVGDIGLKDDDIVTVVVQIE
mmetsp:Transcript_18973/g.48250  ORF Transcript_18973/g.48250 Transcript_18973/m.48250 type:complete len:86 (-) Transcript_18973:126-383(-)